MRPIILRLVGFGQITTLFAYIHIKRLHLIHAKIYIRFGGICLRAIILRWLCLVSHSHHLLMNVECNERVKLQCYSLIHNASSNLETWPANLLKMGT